jgi:hypothetical protein
MIGKKVSGTAALQTEICETSEWLTSRRDSYTCVAAPAALANGNVRSGWCGDPRAPWLFMTREPRIWIIGIPRPISGEGRQENTCRGGPGPEITVRREEKRPGASVLMPGHSSISIEVFESAARLNMLVPIKPSDRPPGCLGLPLHQAPHRYRNRGHLPAVRLQSPRRVPAPWINFSRGAEGSRW